jgi:hypothetical protein
LGGQHNVRAAGFLGFLLEAVQHENGGFKLRYIDHPQSSRSFTDAYFTNAGADAWHWFPIVRLTALLNLIQLVASFSPSIFWKVRRSSREPSQNAMGLWFRVMRLTIQNFV